MKRFIESAAREQVALLPEYLDDYVDAETPRVRGQRTRAVPGAGRQADHRVAARFHTHPDRQAFCLARRIPAGLERRRQKSRRLSANSRSTGSCLTSWPGRSARTSPSRTEIDSVSLFPRFTDDSRRSLLAPDKLTRPPGMPPPMRERNSMACCTDSKAGPPVRPAPRRPGCSRHDCRD